MLDEPTVGLDFVGLGALRDALKSWPGALVVVSHDRDFIESIDIRCEIRLGASREKPLMNTNRTTDSLPTVFVFIRVHSWLSLKPALTMQCDRFIFA